MAALNLAGKTSGFIKLKSPDVASNATVELPNKDGILATLDDVTGGGGDAVATVADGCIYLNNQAITNDYTFPAGKNGMSAGPIDVQGTVEVGDGTWTIVGESGSGGGDVEEAPIDGKIYGRQDKSWTEITGGSGGDSFIAGMIMMWSTNTEPDGWLFCNGAEVDRATYADLFAVIGTTFGVGDGSTTFNLPNYSNRMPIGAGSTYSVADTGGSKDAVVVSHTHTVSINNTTGLSGWWDFKNRGGSSFATPILANSSGGKCTHKNNSNSIGYGEGYRGEAGSGSSRANINMDHGHTGSAVANGVAGTDKNLPPYIGIQFIIKT